MTSQLVSVTEKCYDLKRERDAIKEYFEQKMADMESKYCELQIHREACRKYVYQLGGVTCLSTSDMELTNQSVDDHGSIEKKDPINSDGGASAGIQRGGPGESGMSHGLSFKGQGSMEDRGCQTGDSANGGGGHGGTTGENAGDREPGWDWRSIFGDWRPYAPPSYHTKPNTPGVIGDNSNSGSSQDQGGSGSAGSGGLTPGSIPQSQPQYPTPGGWGATGGFNQTGMNFSSSTGPPYPTTYQQPGYNPGQVSMYGSQVGNFSGYTPGQLGGNAGSPSGQLGQNGGPGGSGSPGMPGGGPGGPPYPTGDHNMQGWYPNAFSPHPMGGGLAGQSSILNISQRDEYAIKGLKFKGEKGDKWRSFCQKVDAITTELGWGDADRCKHIIRMLEGAALDYYTTITSRQKGMSWDQLNKQLETKYGAKELVEAARMELSSCRQRPKETVQEFADRVYELCARALPEEVSNEYFNTMTVHHFSGGVLDQKTSKHLLVSPPKSLHLAVEECRKHQLAEEISSKTHGRVGQISSGSESYEGHPRVSRSSTEESHHSHRREYSTDRSRDSTPDYRSSRSTYRSPRSGYRSPRSDYRHNRDYRSRGSTPEYRDKSYRLGSYPSSRETTPEYRRQKPSRSTPAKNAGGRSGLCYKCNEPWHYARECPQRNGEDSNERRGRSPSPHPRSQKDRESGLGPARESEHGPTTTPKVRFNNVRTVGTHGKQLWELWGTHNLPG